MSVNLIGCSGIATSGKDLFCKIAKSLLDERGYITKKLAFADELKDEINPFLIKYYGIDIWNCSSEEKSLCRPLLVAHGCCKREQTKGEYWVNKIRTKIALTESISSNSYYNDKIDFYFLSDVRFLNECNFIQEELNGYVIHIKKYHIENSTLLYDKYPNIEEEKNDPLVENASDYKLEWEDISYEKNNKPTYDELVKNEYLRNKVKECLSSYLKFLSF